ncbi:MAG TPA: efflux RND transporter periplasmic adaptor subunit [Tepidisphaeraceae bacterium]|jgi:multidrug efflux system membrane fusion protein|nr:efflux RND transporter periplasmic adaptor subunit [Tepidisphaeraceae bacterium]
MIRKVFMLATAAIAAGLAAMALSGCNRASAAGGGFTMPPPVVTTAPVATADVPVYLEEIGRTTASEVVNIIPQVSGKIVGKYFEDGADLHTGEKLFDIDPRPYQAALDQAQAAMEQNQAQLANAKTNFARTASELPSKAVSQQDYDNAKDTMDVADAEVKAAQAAIETAKLNLEYCSIHSPIDGRAGERLVDVGNVVNANSTTLLSIQKLTPIYVDFTVAENELDRVRENLAKGPLKVLIQTPDNPNRDVDGEVTFLDNAVQDGTGTIRLRATVPNKGRELWPGQFVHVRLILYIMKDARLIPAEAVQVGQSGSYVFVIHADKTADQRSITTGQRQGDKIVVLSGLKAGETVVLTGQLMVIPQKAVMIIPTSAGPTTRGAAQ